MLWSSPTPVTPLGCALTKNASVSALECALTNSLDLKSFGISTYEKGRGEGAAPPLASGHAFKRANCGPSKRRLQPLR